MSPRPFIRNLPVGVSPVPDPVPVTRIVERPHIKLLRRENGRFRLVDSHSTRRVPLSLPRVRGYFESTEDRP